MSHVTSTSFSVTVVSAFGLLLAVTACATAVMVLTRLTVAIGL